MAQDNQTSRNNSQVDLQNKESTAIKEEDEQCEQIDDHAKHNYLRVYKKINQIDVKESEQQFEEQFNSHCKVAAQAKANYLSVYQQMISKLSAEQLEPLAEVLRQHENEELQHKDKLAEKIGTKLYEELSTALEAFWEEYNIDSSIATLAMLKEQFKKYEGTDWKMNSKTIAERVRPKQMRMKKLKQVYLERQLKFQNERVETLLADNIKWRARIQEISSRRCCLHEEITKLTDRYKKNIPQVKKMISELLEML